MCIRDSNKVIQLVVGGDQRGLPVAALRQFAIAGDDKYAILSMLSVSYTHLTLPTSDLV